VAERDAASWRRGDYLEFEEVSAGSRKTKRIAVVAVRAKRPDDEAAGTLGYIEWFGRWRQYVFVPLETTVYSAGCLADIAAELRAQQERWRTSRD